MPGLRAASQPRGACAPAASPSFRTTQSGRGREGGRGAAARRPRPRPGRQGSPGGAAPGRPRRRPRVPRGPSCCTRSRPPPPWPRPRGIQRARGRAGSAARRAGLSTAGPPARSAPASRRTGAAAAPGPGGRSCREAGAETGEASARGRGQRGLAPAAPHGPARRRPKAPLAKRPQRCPARGAAAVTVRPRSRTRARVRCGARCSPSPARPAASAPSARGAAAVAAAALGPAQPPSLRASPPRSCAQRTRARRQLPSRLPALRDVSTSCRTQRPPKPAPSARKMSARAPRGAALLSRPVSQSLAQAGNWDASRWNHSSLPASAFALGLGADWSVPRPGLRGGRRGSGF